MADDKREKGSKSEQKTEPYKVKYVGPYYELGVRLPDGEIVRPKEMTAAEIKSLIAKYPPAAQWFA